MPQTLTTQQITQSINAIKNSGTTSEKVQQATAVYDTLRANGYNYAGWAGGVARADTVTGVVALDYLQGTALMGLGSEACRNLTTQQIDKIKVDMATVWSAAATTWSSGLVPANTGVVLIDGLHQRPGDVQASRPTITLRI